MKCKVALLKPTPIDYLELFLGMFKFSKIIKILMKIL